LREAADHDKKAKKNLKRFAKKETEAEIEKQAEEDAKKNYKEKLPSRPSLYHIVNYMSNYFLRYLPTAICEACKNPLINKPGEELTNKMKPERLYCGHWMHI
jgi:formylmethanofuran dehydrogenase subunit E